MSGVVMKRLQAKIAFLAVTMIAAGAIGYYGNGVSAADSVTDDIVAIQQLTNRYCHELDRGTVDGVMGVFHEDVVFMPLFESDRVYNGIGPVREWYTRYKTRTSAGLELLRHFFSTHLVEVDGNQATSVVYMDFYTVVNDSPRTTHGFGRYEDKLVKEDGAWKIIERKVIIDRSYQVGPTE